MPMASGWPLVSNKSQIYHDFARRRSQPRLRHMNEIVVQSCRADESLIMCRQRADSRLCLTIVNFPPPLSSNFRASAPMWTYLSLKHRTRKGGRTRPGMW